MVKTPRSSAHVALHVAQMSMAAFELAESHRQLYDVLPRFTI